ncbi:MAG: GAF domain-containing protein [Anaerolineales bacterium]|nr:GAF domain-containing protein [Anaerolineales bacterium]
MLFNIRWGSLRLKIIAWFLAPSAVILLAIAVVAFFVVQETNLRYLVAFLLFTSLVIPMLVIGLGVSRITSPITELTRAAQEVARGKFGLTVEAETGDEIEELAHQFNLMSQQLKDMYTTLEQRVADRTRELATLNTIATVVSRSLKLEEVLDSALVTVLERLELQAGAIYLVENDQLQLKAMNGFSEGASSVLKTLQMSESLSGQAILQHKPVATNIQAYAQIAEPSMVSLLTAENVQTLVSTPLAHHGRTCGAMTLVTQAQCTFSPQEMELLLAIGQQIGVAVENARLYEQARLEIELRRQADRDLLQASVDSERQNRELILLNHVITATTSDLEPKAILEVVCHELVRAFGVAQSAAALLNPDGESLTVIAEHKAPHLPSALSVIIPVSENPATLYVMKQKAPLALSDAQHDILLRPVHEIMRTRGTASLLILPIIQHGEVIGTIGMDSTSPREFTPEEIALAARVSAAVAQALEKTEAESD